MMSNDGPPREEFRSRSRSPQRSPPRGRSPSPARRRRSRSYSPPRSGGSSRRRSRSRSPRGGGRYPRDDYHDRRPDYDRGPPPPRYGPPQDDYRGGGYRDDRYRDDRGYGGPPSDHYDGPRRGGGYGPPHGGGEVRRDRQGRRRDEGPPGVSLLVRNVAHDTRSEDLQQAFGRIGVIRDVYIPRDFHTQQPKGFAFIEFATPEMAREAKHEMDRFMIRGRQIEVVFAQERRKTPNEMRGRMSDDRRGPPSRGGSGGGFQRSSSFERHKQRERNNPRDRDQDDGPSERQDDRDD